MRVNFYTYSNLNTKKNSQNISMKANLPNFAKRTSITHYFGNPNSVTKIGFENALNLIKNPYLSSVVNKIYKKEIHCLPQSVIDFFVMFDGGLENVKDKKITNYINKSLKNILKSKDSFGSKEVKTCMKLEKLSNLTDAYNTLNGNYSRLYTPDIWEFDEIQFNPSLPKGYLDALKSKPEAYERFIAELDRHYANPKSRTFSGYTRDFIYTGKLDSIANFWETNNRETEDYIYTRYYLKSKHLPKTHRKLLEEIYKNTGVKVLISEKNVQASDTLEMIKNELNNWKTYSNGNAKFPVTLIVTPINENFVTGSTAGYVNAFGNIYISRAFDIPSINCTLRHELTHINELKQNSFDVTKDNDLAELINSIIKSKQVPTEQGIKTVLDFDKCKYKEEFLKAGISPRHIKYAYTNKSEFLAVIAEGDISKCSDEFKNVLIKLGLPKYILKMPLTFNSDTKYKIKRLEKVMKEHSEAKDYNSIVKYLQQYY